MSLPQEVPANPVMVASLMVALAAKLVGTAEHWAAAPERVLAALASSHVGSARPVREID